MSDTDSTSTQDAFLKAAADSATSPFGPREGETAPAGAPHIYCGKYVCATGSRGFATPGNSNPQELVLDASEGFIPLWAGGVTLRWRFHERSMRYFQNPTAAKDAIRQLMRDALSAWGEAVPVRFKETSDAWDFQLRMSQNDDCDANGCTLASAFFPDQGRHDLVVYPKMLEQARQEMVDTLVHELGHVFGLRHFFAEVSETAWPSVKFGEHKPFTIMNYGSLSQLTEADKSDLQRLYASVRSNELTEINGTPIVLVRPYHELISQ